MYLRPLVLIIFALFNGMLSFTATSYAQSSKASKTEVKSPFNIMFSAARSRSLYNQEEGSLRETNDFELAPMYTWSKGKTILYMTYSQDLQAKENASDFNDTAIINNFNGWEMPKIKLSPALIVILPQSKASRQMKSLQGGVTGKLTASIPARLLIPGFSLAGAVSLGRNVHYYKTDANGGSNNQHTSRQIFMTSYSIGAFTFAGEFHHISAWSYEGALKEAYEHFEEVSLALGDHLGFTIGHSNADTVFKENGYEAQYKLVDENTSMVYAKLSMEF